jgi:hypothetical protein
MDENHNKIIDPKYETEVLSLDKCKLIASTKWLIKSDALTENDLKKIRQIREHRNEIAHELQDIVFYHDRDIKIELIKPIRDLVFKIDSWWIKNVEIPIHNQVSSNQIPENEEIIALSGPVIILDIIIENVIKGIVN